MGWPSTSNLRPSSGLPSHPRRSYRQLRLVVIPGPSICFSIDQGTRRLKSGLELVSSVRSAKYSVFSGSGRCSSRVKQVIRQRVDANALFPKVYLGPCQNCFTSIWRCRSDNATCRGQVDVPKQGESTVDRGCSNRYVYCCITYESTEMTARATARMAGGTMRPLRRWVWPRAALKDCIVDGCGPVFLHVEMAGSNSMDGVAGGPRSAFGMADLLLLPEWICE